MNYLCSILDYNIDFYRLKCENCIMKTLNYLFFIMFIAFLACSENASLEKEEQTEEEQTEEEVQTPSEPKYKDLIQDKLGSMNMPRPADSYNYPVYPGMEEWAQFKTVWEMVNACQVPEDILKTMSTQAVIQAIWEYPFLFDILHRFEYQSDFEGTFLKNNAYNELIKRTDAGTALLERMLALDPVKWGPWFGPKAFEVLTSQAVFLSQLDDDAKKKLIKVTLKNDELRQKKGSNYPFRELTWILIGRTLVSANYPPFMEEYMKDEQMKLFLEARSYIYEEVVYGAIPQIIVEYAERYLTDN
ncbi:hypothetical protein AGMMS50239_02410 [Bacteroidia bacterium]|nr:hypothetical protein AGMMS50239_02410 [Bacteroidia bacterium]